MRLCLSIHATANFSAVSLTVVADRWAPAWRPIAPESPIALAVPYGAGLPPQKPIRPHAATPSRSGKNAGQLTNKQLLKDIFYMAYNVLIR